MFIMAAKKYTSDRKRSRLVTKRSKTDVLKKNKLVTGIVLIIIVVVAIAGVYVVYTGNNDNDNNESGDQSNGSNGQVTNESNPIAVIDTSMGTIKVELYEDKLPITAGNFIDLANDGYYDGLIFHRVKDSFMIQAGRYYPDGSQKQSPYGPIDLEIHPDVKHVDGAISMGQIPGDPNSATSEFFICDGVQRGLDDDYLQETYGQRGYAAFGMVIEGIDVMRDIASTPHDASLEPNPGGGKPLEDVIIYSIEIENN